MLGNSALTLAKDQQLKFSLIPAATVSEYLTLPFSFMVSNKIPV